MSQSAISNRLTSLNGFKGKELDLHAKLSIQAKQNALPKGKIFNQIFLYNMRYIGNFKVESKIINYKV